MSSLRQELAAILMDYTDEISDQSYRDILQRLSEIPNHKDPKKAHEIQKQLDKTIEITSMLKDENEILSEELDQANKEASDYRKKYLSSKRNNTKLKKELNLKLVELDNEKQNIVAIKKEEEDFYNNQKAYLLSQFRVDFDTKLSKKTDLILDLQRILNERETKITDLEKKIFKLEYKIQEHEVLIQPIVKNVQELKSKINFKS